MNSLIELDSGKIAEVAQKMAVLREDVENIRVRLGKLEDQLENDVYDLRQSAGEEATENISGISTTPRVKLREQREKLDDIIKLLNSAADLTDSSNETLRDKAEKLKLALSAMTVKSVGAAVISATAIASTAISSSIGYLGSEDGLFSDTKNFVKNMLENTGKVVGGLGYKQRVENYIKENPKCGEYVQVLRSQGFSDEEIYSIAKGSGVDGLMRNAKWYTNTKAYEGNSTVNFVMKDVSDGDYSDYNVVQGFDISYVLKQKNNVQCTATADVMAGSIASGKKQTVVDSRDWCADGAKWTFTKSVKGTAHDTVAEQCKTIYNQILDGKPVVVRVKGHSVLAIGLKNGVDPNNVQPSDILIVDPGDGKVKAADQVYYGHTYGKNLTMYDDPGWGLRIPK